MSRAYKVEVEAKGICAQELIRVMSKLMWVNAWSTESNGLSYFSGAGCLCGGQNEEEVHAQIYAALKAINAQALVCTRWICMEDRPRSEYGDRIR